MSSTGAPSWVGIQRKAFLDGWEGPSPVPKVHLIIASLLLSIYGSLA